eukprot:gnl/MRDRNA2_/MRDRNA2_104970_c0_seq1.p1 gnl/MRDRNA2_/MRDRNA2_104970_c0~~gnl/MRDRNA2_/MRDRNA2_104970_c0_seq1.p1  ORF type:complete len:169 (+),score=49.17 gnl/MRDRNA2_/MRDRNA2_104970_c0_seq1:83-589(+)
MGGDDDDELPRLIVNGPNSVTELTKGDSAAAAGDESSSDDDANILLCEQGPGGGNMDYYLGTDRPGKRKAEDNTEELALAVVKETSTELQRSGSVAETVAPDESVESILSQIEFTMDVSEEKPWRQTGANLQDYFNFNMDEQSWKNFLLRQVKLRLEAKHRKKIGIAR